MFIRILCILSLIFLFLIPSKDNSSGQKAELLWDQWGVPHIYGSNDSSLFKAFGWSQLHNHGNLILRLYGQSRGTAAEYWGSDYLESDRLVRRLGIPTRAQDWYRQQNPEFRANIDAFVNGMNAYAEIHMDRLDPELIQVLPIRPEDTLAHVQRVFHFGSVISEEHKSVGGEYLGSNAWAISPGNTAKGKTLLLANPHLPWSGAHHWFEVHLNKPGLNAYGAALVGMPMILTGFTDDLGWSHTGSPGSGGDLYQLTVNKKGYLWNGELKPFEIREEEITVLQPDGAFAREKLEIRSSIHGPVISEENGAVLALRVSGLDQPLLYEQYWDMIQAKSLESFDAAFGRLQNPLFNLIYADRSGHIMYQHGGRLPVRPGGDWQSWQGTLPGDSPESLWQSTHEFTDLPRIIDPPSGWVQNANDPPWTATGTDELVPRQYPTYLAPKKTSLRAYRARQILSRDKNISLEKLVEYRYDTRVLLADKLLPDLLAAARKHSKGWGIQAGDVLQAWDRRVDANSRGGVLFTAWIEEMSSLGTDFTIPEQWKHKMPTDEVMAKALDLAGQKVHQEFGSLAIPWGKVHRIRYANYDLPANGGPGELGIFHVFGYKNGSQNRLEVIGGDSFTSLVSFEKGVRAKVLLCTGNATQPNSPHHGDQLGLLSRKQMRDAWRTRAEVNANLSYREVLR